MEVIKISKDNIYGSCTPQPPVPPQPLTPSFHPNMYFSPTININNNCNCDSSTVPDIPINPPESPASMMGYVEEDFSDVGQIYKLIAEVPVTVGTEDLRLITANISWTPINNPCPCGSSINGSVPEENFAEFLVTRAEAAVPPLAPTQTELSPQEEAIYQVPSQVLGAKLDALNIIDAEKLDAKDQVYRIYARVNDGVIESLSPTTLMVRKYPKS